MKTVSPEWPDKLPAELFFLGEAPGDQELWKGTPFVPTAPAGKIYNMLLEQAGIQRYRIVSSNVINFKLPDNKIERIGVTKKEAIEDFNIRLAKGSCDSPEEWIALDFEDWVTQPVAKGKYLKAEIVAPQLERVSQEIKKSGAEVVVALGGLAIWALLALPGHGVVKKLRGTVHDCKLVPGIKVVVSYHPAYIMRKYHHRTMTREDFKTAKRLANGGIEAPPVDIFIPVEAEDIRSWLWEYRRPLAVDIETTRGQIDCIGFGEKENAMCVPFFDNKTFIDYWDPEDEVEARGIAVSMLRNPEWVKIFQNGSYDVQMLWEIWKVKVRGYVHDTRLLHHALWPELPKDLGTMAATHTDMPQWKPIKGKRQKRED